MLANRLKQPIMGKSVEKVAKSGEKWGRMWKTFHRHQHDKPLIKAASGTNYVSWQV
jgi:hypothetical protein